MDGSLPSLLPATPAFAADLHAALRSARDTALACRRGPLHAVPGAALALREAAERLGLVLLAALEQGNAVSFDADGGLRISIGGTDAPATEPPVAPGVAAPDEAEPCRRRWVTASMRSPARGGGGGGGGGKQVVH
jgi:hypothetical protein